MSVPGVPCSGSCKLHLLLKTVTQGVSFLGADKEKNPGTAGSPEAAEGTCFWKVGCKRLFGLSAPEGRRARSAFSIQPVSKVFSGPSCQWSFYESVFALLFRGGMQALVWAIGTRGQTNKVGMQVVFGANSTGVQTKKNGKEVLAVRVLIRIARGAEPRVEEPSDKLRCSSAGLVGNGRDFRPGHLSIALFSLEGPAR
ncbi:uncharacterized protein LOC126648212 isoform X9 [Myiozetetes cayanensis]|uniref:uncharacterized protein LOC126648212 isoform X9 n=1 Tax=Myiozetetes cayanensis TaxID=478635 RepID=UPI00215F9354|nr:uncharacterized protein LOC126648212 isoform X9 [Myiozetetes cayanensis]